VVFPPATASLENHNTNPKLYMLASQKVASVVVGCDYRFSAGIKTLSFDASAALEATRRYACSGMITMENGSAATSRVA
jgi:hypothetical protein